MDLGHSNGTSRTRKENEQTLFAAGNWGSLEMCVCGCCEFFMDMRTLSSTPSSCNGTKRGNEEKLSGNNNGPS